MKSESQPSSSKYDKLCISNNDFGKFINSSYQNMIGCSTNLKTTRRRLYKKKRFKTLAHITLLRNITQRIANGLGQLDNSN